MTLSLEQLHELQKSKEFSDLTDEVAKKVSDIILNDAEIILKLLQTTDEAEIVRLLTPLIESATDAAMKRR